MIREKSKIELVYSIFCDDVRLEVGNKLSAMGIFQNIFVPQLPITLIKFAIISHWQGEGQYLAEVRILAPDRSQPIAVSPPTSFQIPSNGYADNVTFFANITFAVPGDYIVQTMINSNVFAEQILHIGQELPQIPLSSPHIN